MPIVAQDARIDFLQPQVLMSRNVRGGVLLSAALGDLNRQIEHHLFPSMPSPNLKHAQPLVRAHCAALDVPYAEVEILTAYGIVIDHLNNVGRSARAAFDCPLADQPRTKSRRNGPGRRVAPSRVARTASPCPPRLAVWPYWEQEGRCRRTRTARNGSGR